MKLSTFLDDKISPFLLGVFFGRYLLSDDKKYIYSVSTFKSSKYGCESKYDTSRAVYLDILNSLSRCDIWTDEKPKGAVGNYFAALENDLNICEETFFNKLYAKLFQHDFIFDEELTESKKMFLRGFMEPRGSIDTLYQYIAQDYFYRNTFELKRARLLVDRFSVPISYLNLNFRELQKQFITKENKRNSQLRINLAWYVSNIGLFNPYKASIVSNKYPTYIEQKPINKIIYFSVPEVADNTRTTFLDRLDAYVSNVFGIKLTPRQTENLRNAFNFENDADTNFSRNRNIVELARYRGEQECSCCKNIYKAEDRTFIQRRTGMLYFEIHHFISLNNTPELDVIDNLVKVCPACHAALKKGVGEIRLQKQYIKQILENEPDAYEFAKHMLETSDIDEIIEKVHTHLR